MARRVGESARGFCCPALGKNVQHTDGRAKAATSVRVRVDRKSYMATNRFAPPLPMCKANPLIGSIITHSMWERSEQSAAQFMDQHTLLLSRLVHSATATATRLPIPVRGRNPDGSPRQNNSIESMQPTLSRRWDLFNFEGVCPTSQLQSARGGWEGSKFVCGIEVLSRLGAKCIIYSVGSNNDFSFESSMVRQTQCQIHTFDCNVAPRVPPTLASRVIFHRWCFGAATQNLTASGRGARVQFKTWDATLEELGHANVDLLKLDIEGYEWDVFDAMIRSSAPLPFQIATELHLTAFWDSARLWWAGRRLTAGEVALWARRFFDLGYRVVKRSDNPHWPQATEVTLVRFRC